MTQQEVMAMLPAHREIKIAIVSIMQRHRQESLCPVCQEIVEDLMNIDIEGIIENHVETLEHNINELEDRVVVYESIERENRSRMYNIEEYVREQAKIREGIEKKNQEIKKQAKMIKKAVQDLIDYLREKKNMNLRRQDKYKKDKVIASNLEGITKSLEEL